MKRLAGRVAVVTGAASGIGQALAEGLAHAGCDLALVDLDAAALDETARRVTAAGRRATRHAADVADRARMEALPDEVLAAHGGHVHVVVNNAGVNVAAPFVTHSLEDFEWIMGVNFWGVVHGCKFFLPHLAREDEAHLVNLSSLAGLVPFAGQTSYCATKFAVHGFSECLAAELGGTSVGVTTVHPGTVRTNILRSSRFSDPAIRDRLAGLMARHGLPAEKAAQLILGAVRRNQAHLVIGADAHLLVALRRAWPALPRTAIGYLYRRIGLG
jgi:NAD(P)-dependent dehydrogenase (short-subunit alcohol dehydrogenase family)